MTTKIERTPGIPPVAGTNFRASVEALKMMVDKLSGAVGPNAQRAVRVCELVDSGLLRLQPDGSLGTGAGDDNVVHRTGNETIRGVKTFTDKLIVDPGSSGISGGQLSLRNTSGYVFDIGMGVSGPTSPDAFFANRHPTGRIGFYTGSSTLRLRIADTALVEAFATLVVDGNTAPNATLQVLRPGTTPAGSFVNISSPASVPGIIAQFGTTKRRDIRFTDAGIEFGASTSTGGPGMQLTVLDNGHVGLAQTATTPFFVGPWSGNASYTAIRTAAMSGSEYLILATDTVGPDTFVSAKIGGKVYVRANANGAAGQIEVTTTGANVNGVISDVYANVRYAPVISMTTNLNAQTVYSGRHVVKTVSSALQFILQPNATVAVDVGTAIMVSNDGATTNDITITRGSGVVCYRNGTNANITLTPGQSVMLYKTDTNRWQASN